MKLAQEPPTLTQPPVTVDKLCGGVAHELNNLLSVILGEADLALMFGAVTPELRQSFVAIRRAGGQAAALTRQLLSLSHRQLVQPTVFNLSDVLRDESMDPARSVARNIEHITCSSASNAWVRADKSQIEQVVHNLAENAREAMPEGGRLTLQTSNVTLDETDMESRGGIGPGEYVLLTVTDTGTGMTDEVKAHMFEPFFTTKALGKGAGLGLATCLSIVKQSGGHVRIESEVGVGTVCEVHLPQAPAGTQGSAMDGAELPTGTEVILLTDDDDAVRQVATRILQGLGYHVLQAANGSDALRILTANESTVDLLVTDVILPHIGGRELAKRARDVRPSVRVLFTSGYTNDVILQQQLTAHDVTFVQKPFTPASLGRKVREVLDAPARTPA